jgi:glycosyltransferase involved in cell wall biosynthesis
MADAITAPSLAVLNAVRAHLNDPLEHARVIPNPITPADPADRWTLEGCQRQRVLFVGRFDRHKGGDVIIRAFAELLKTHPRATLTFVGPDQGYVDNAGRRHNLADYIAAHVSADDRDRITWLGVQPPGKLTELRRRAHVVVVPSRFETFGNTAVEALSLGCPVVAGDTGGLSEIVEHEVSGLKHHPGDADDLAEQIRRIFDDSNFAQRLSTAAVEQCQRRYDPRVIADETIAFYQQVANA